MFWTMYALVILNISVYAFAVIYLYIFRKTHEKYIGYWGLSWMIYGIGLVLDVLIYNNIPIPFILIGQEIVFSLSIYFLLSGTYIFINRRKPGIWFIILIANIIWGLLSLYFEFSYIITVTPLSIYFSIISIYTGIIFLQNWEYEGYEKVATGIAFLLWGVHKSYYFYLHPNFSVSPTSYITEIMLIIGLNSCLVLAYLQKNRMRLTKNEQIFRLLTENSHDMIYLSQYDPEPYFEYVSPNCKKIIGYSQEEFYANPYLLDDIVHPEDKPLFELTLNPKLSPKESVTLRYRHKKGHYLWIDEYTTLIYDKEGNPFGIEGIMRDNSELILNNNKILQAEKERQQLLSTISHELKTPITTIRGYVDAILDRKIPEKESHQYLLNIQNKVGMLELLINDLFELSQFESNQIKFKFSQIQVGHLLNSIYEKLEDDVKHVGLSFDLVIDASVSNREVIVDVERIEQAFNNLIYNSIKYTKKSGYISILCRSEDKQTITIQIRDNGAGISDTDLPHIFERFYRGHNSSVQGSGLGLAITKEIIIKHQGSIEVSSQLGKGTSFEISLPVI